jgi:ABC-type transport system involved in multi-copper enzyme maturation permease subunit
MTVFLYDLIQTTRRGRVAALRTGYALALLVALGGAFVARFPGSLAADRLFAPITSNRGTVSTFAIDFVTICLLVQFAAAVVLTPIYAAGAIAEERQRGTLDAVLLTDLSPAEIVIGRFAARWLTVAGLLITGLPVLALTQLWGGIPWEFLVFGASLTLLTTLSLAGIGVLCSVRATSARTAVATTYAVAAVFGACAAVVPLFRAANPWFVTGQFVVDGIFGGPRTPWPMILAGYAVWHVAICLIALVSAVWLLRPQPLSKIERALVARAYERLPAGSRARVALAPQLLAGAPAPFSSAKRPTLRPTRLWPLPAIGADPLLWKELNFGGTPAGELLRLIAYVVVGIGLSVGLATGKMTGLLSVRSDSLLLGGRWVVHPITLDLTTALLTAMMVGTALQAAAAIGRERERRTLDPLLALPGGSAAVLRAKWLGNILRNRLLASLLGLTWALSLLGGMLPIAAVFWLVLAAAIHGAFLASLGVCISIVTPGAGRAMAYALLGLAAAWTAPLLMSAYWLGLFPDAAHAAPWVTAFFQEGLTPPMTWRFLAAAAADPPPYWLTNDRIVGVFLGLGAYAAAAWALWRLSRFLFYRAAGAARQA